MIKLIYIEHNGERHEVDAAAGTSVMQAARDVGIPGILGDCGGVCSCATCHVYVDPEWIAKLHQADSRELETLEGALDVEPNSRLGCQIIVTSQLNGLTLRLPESLW